MSLQQRYAMAQTLKSQGAYVQAAALTQRIHAQGYLSSYELACDLALAGDTQGAMFWLQQAAIEEGVDPQQARSDPDLRSLRWSWRWRSLARFLDRTAAYWRFHAPTLVPVYIPPQLQTTPNAAHLPTVVWLHGMGGEPSVGGFREIALYNQVALVGVSGTQPTGPISFEWSEDIALDHAHIQQALAGQSEVLVPQGVVLMGFSQGAQLAVELLAAYPEHYQGALALSPGGFWESAHEQAVVASQGRVLLSVGEAEHALNREMAREDQEWLASSSLQVHRREVPEQRHTLPPDFEQAPRWVAWILGAEGSEAPW